MTRSVCPQFVQACLLCLNPIRGDTVCRYLVEQRAVRSFPVPYRASVSAFGHNEGRNGTRRLYMYPVHVSGRHISGLTAATRYRLILFLQLLEL